MKKLIKKTDKKGKTAIMPKKKPVPDVAPEHHFWVNDGRVLTNLRQLPGALRSMDKATFEHHVNSEKNDFANWIEDVMCEKKLGRDIRKASSKNNMMKVLRTRL